MRRFLLGLFGLFVLIAASRSGPDARPHKRSDQAAAAIETRTWENRMTAARVERERRAETRRRDAEAMAAAETARRSATARLVQAMTAFLEAKIPTQGERFARILNVEGLAWLIVDEVEQRAQRGAWLPLSREKAPWFLTAVSYHESSFRWNKTDLRGARGEGGSWQVSPSAARIFGFEPARVASDPRTCLRAALAVFEYCARKCGDVPGEGWLACYAQQGQCTGADDVVDARFETTRALIRYGGQ